MGMSSASHAKGKRNGARPEMNVTPLVDVVLVLLIIFMVITPLLTKQMPLSVPSRVEAQAATPTNESLVVTVDANGHTRINRDQVERNELRARLAPLVAARADRTVFFDADDNAPYGAAVAAMDLVRAAGARSIAVSPTALAVP